MGINIDKIMTNIITAHSEIEKIDFNDNQYLNDLCKIAPYLSKLRKIIVSYQQFHERKNSNTINDSNRKLAETDENDEMESISTRQMKYGNRIGQVKKACYVCGVKLYNNSMRHFQYKDLCFVCGNKNIEWKELKKDYTGKVAIITGGRIKIGYETAIRLLRKGCTVIVSTRFVDDCIERYKKEHDYENFKNRLYIYQMNLLNLDEINMFVKFVKSRFNKVDYLINNAAQTIRRPMEFYKNEIEKSGKYSIDNIDKNIIMYNDDQMKMVLKISLCNEQQEIEYNNALSNENNICINNKYDKYGQSLDLREVNSWVLDSNEVSPAELAEVHIINAIAPYLLTTKLIDLLKRTEQNDYTYITNVTSMEGVFDWKNKLSNHPHTNMAKASLNMFTRTCGKQYFDLYQIIMIGVDTGWNNIMHPKKCYEVESPLDVDDGAARILYPIENNLKAYGILYKDCLPRAW